MTTHARQTSLFSRRLLAVLIIMLVLIGSLIARLIYLQIIEHPNFSSLAKKNQLNLIPIAPPRGLIFDRNGVLLAGNKAVYSLAIIPGQVTHLAATLKHLATIIPLSKNELAAFYKRKAQSRASANIILKTELSYRELARFYLHRYQFPGIHVNTQLIRYYPFGKTMVSVLGYVSRINAKELAQVDAANYSASDYIGKIGIEKHYEAQLHGKVGYQQVETDASGDVVRVVKRIKPVAGDNLYLSIDSRLQQVASKALSHYAGAVVAINPQNGQLLALVSSPSYDPNAFVQGISSSNFQKLRQSKQRPLYNRAVRGLYAPGSTVKPFYALAALDQNIISPSDTIFDPGWFRLPGSDHVFRDWKKHGHGLVNVEKAIMVSCDTFFYQLAVKMGIARLDNALTAFGFGQKTGLDVNEELTGLVPDPTWKKRNRKQSWYTGDTVITGIGQGFLLATPLQLATATAAIAMHGQRYKPSLLMAVQPPNHPIQQEKAVAESSIKLQQSKYWNFVIHAMQGVVYGAQGTGYRLGKPSYDAAGKTGTAEVYKPEQYQDLPNQAIPEKYRSQSLFIVFAPVNHPVIALSVVVEHHEGAAVVVAKQILDYYFTHIKQTQGMFASNDSVQAPKLTTRIANQMAHANIAVKLNRKASVGK